MIDVVIVGAKGRMGQTLIQLIRNNPEFELAGEVDEGDKLEKIISKADVVIDFSWHEATLGVVKIAAKAGKPILIGTTGHTEKEKKKIFEFGDKIPLILAPNCSIGVNVLFYLVRVAGMVFGEEFDREIVEVHHRRKKDAPSGTAKKLLEILAETEGKTSGDIGVFGRSGDVGEKNRDEVGVHAVRLGDVVGDHTVFFAGNGERVELTHRAGSRDAFATGALRAAKWLVGKKPGIYHMMDVLGLKFKQGINH